MKIAAWGGFTGILLVLDQCAKTELSGSLIDGIGRAAAQAGQTAEALELAPGDIAPCTGCLRCWADQFGVCVRGDCIAELKSAVGRSSMAVFLSPVRFGHFSSIIKNAIDRGAFAQVGVHVEKPPEILVVGYGEAVDDEEKSTFTDIINRHMGSADVIHPELKNIPIKAFVVRTGRDAEAICAVAAERLCGAEGRKAE